jgi:uncharacterized protein YqjF (DUF2071 family)
MTAACCIDASETREIEGAFRAILKADWREALFVHFRADPAVLQPLVPLELDLYEGQAYVSLVAFTQDRLRPCRGGSVAEWLSRPLARHEFLNVRTYVRRGDERGIYFLAEWIPNRLATALGPRLYGLPYHVGRCAYVTREDGGERRVACASGRFECRANWEPAAVARACERGGEDAFLLERYAAFTERGGVLRRFRIRHEPWQRVEADVRIEACDLLSAGVEKTPCGAQYSAGLRDVQIGRPELVLRARRKAWVGLVPAGVVAAG